jgi:uncharacterized protein (DUF362 family)
MGDAMPVIAVRHDGSVRYPPFDQHSPGEAFPETPVKAPISAENHVYGLARQCLKDAGGDVEHFGLPNWNPLGQWIKPGSQVFILPNLVVNRRAAETIEDFQGKCTHGSMVRVAVDYATIATGAPSRVAFGNAALQSTDYDKVTHETGMYEIAQFYRTHVGVDIGPRDLRGVITRWTRFGALIDRVEQPSEEVVLVDLGSESLLDVFYRNNGPVEFRVSDYDRREIAEYHGPGRHVYAVNRRVLEADTIISVPKLKTHEKVGITCALKGTVGAIARKECLAHHRKGGPQQLGDEFPKRSALRHVSSSLADRVTTLNRGLFANGIRVASKVLYKLLRSGPHGIMAGAWHGNDTAWRMSLDIARILRFARTDGSLAATPQRNHLVMIDGIVSGEGEGPVYPVGRHTGVVMFGSDPVWTDYACALVMQFDPSTIPLIARAATPMRYPATGNSIDDVHFVLNGEAAGASELADVLDTPFTPPKGWRGRVGTVNRSSRNYGKTTAAVEP